MAYEKQTWTTGQIIGDTKLNHIEEGIEMANSNYEKTVWNTGDVITAEKLNKIEEGIASGGDFSTAEVTLIVADNTTSYINYPSVAGLVTSYDGEEEVQKISSVTLEPGGYMSPTPQEKTVTVVLYQGRVSFPMSDDVITDINGDISYDSDSGIYEITGDCTISMHKYIPG